MESIRPTPVEQLRKPHPDQRNIDAAAAALLKATAVPMPSGPQETRRHAGPAAQAWPPAEEPR
jgi:hypothetical protein